jgi:hypothetical protein
MVAGARSSAAFTARASAVVREPAATAPTWASAATMLARSANVSVSHAKSLWATRSAMLTTEMTAPARLTTTRTGASGGKTIAAGRARTPTTWTPSVNHSQASFCQLSVSMTKSLAVGKLAGTVIPWRVRSSRVTRARIWPGG